MVRATGAGFFVIEERQWLGKSRVFLVGAPRPRDMLKCHAPRRPCWTRPLPRVIGVRRTKRPIILWAQQANSRSAPTGLARWGPGHRVDRRGGGWKDLTAARGPHPRAGPTG